ncbi:MAG: hypothetical protein O7A07_10105 [Acidobacteria bacterium]|nr:hypothetical protein [Acidobacteriota bacterium]
MSAVLMAGLVFSGTSPERQGISSSGCEPGADIQVSARVVEIIEQGAKAHVVIEMLLASRLDLTSFRIHQSRLSVPSRGGARLGVARSTAEALTPMVLYEADPGRLSGRIESAFQTTVPASRRLLRRGDLVAAEDATLIREGAPQAIRYTVTLSRGLDHHLLLDVAAEDSRGEIHAAQAYVRVGLDPRTQPERLEGLVQFRARQVR